MGACISKQNKLREPHILHTSEELEHLMREYEFVEQNVTTTKKMKTKTRWKIFSF